MATKIRTKASGYNYTNEPNFLDSYWIYLPNLSKYILDKLKDVRPPLSTKYTSKRCNIEPHQYGVLEVGWNHVSVLWDRNYVESLTDIKAYLEGMLGSLPEEVKNKSKQNYISKINTTNISL
jgi:hypothetical protein